MKTVFYVPLLVALLPCAPEQTAAPAKIGTMAPREDEAPSLDPRDLVQHAKITLGDAIGRALAARPGRAVEAELEGEVIEGKLGVFFEVMVLADNRELFEVRLDPATGAVGSNEAAAEDEDEVPGFVAALRHGELDLAALIGKAESYVKGTPVSAALEFEDGSPRCDVAVVNTRFLLEIEMEARAGHLLEIELRSESVGDDGEEADEDEGEEEDEGGEDEEDEDGEEEDGEEEDGEDEDEEEEEEAAEHEQHAEGGEHGRVIR